MGRNAVWKEICCLVVSDMRMFAFSKVASNFALLAGVNIAGVLYYYLAELAQRKAFSETRCYIRSLVNIDEQRRKQVCVCVCVCVCV